jgi:hypothetical protein
MMRRKIIGGFVLAAVLSAAAVFGFGSAFREAPLNPIGEPQYLSNFLVDDLIASTNIAERIPLAQETSSFWINRESVAIKQIYLVTDHPTIDVYIPVIGRKQLTELFDGISHSNYSYIPPSVSNGLAIRLTHLFLIEGTDGRIYTLSIRGLSSSVEAEKSLFSKITEILPAMTFQKVLQNVKVSFP